MAWTLTRPGVASLVIGGKKIEQIKDNLAAAELKLTEDQIMRLNEVSNPPLLYLYWHQEKFAKGTFNEGDLALFGGRPEN